MAEINERGQMLLIAGIALAVLFVALALLVNAAIYTDNVATRGGDSAGEVLEYQAGIVDSIGGLIDAENAVGDDFTRIKANVSNGTQTIDDIHRKYHLRRGVWTNVSFDEATVERGLLIREAETTEFTDWSVDASAARGFVIELDTENSTDTDPFRIDLNGTEVRVTVNKTSNEVVVTGGEGGVECKVPADDTIRFDVTGERLGGEPCRFDWPDMGSASEIGLIDASNAAGSYELTVESTNSTSDLPAETDATESVYSAETTLRIDSPQVSYERTVRIARGEPDV